MAQKPVPVLICDIDGTIRHGLAEMGRYINSPDDVVVFPEVRAQLERWADNGGRVVGVSNQGGIALLHLTNEQCAETMRRTNELAGGHFEVILWCPHWPTIDGDCPARKPNTGMITQALDLLRTMHPDEYYPPELALMVGDQPDDQLCADAAGIPFQWARHWRAASPQPV